MKGYNELKDWQIGKEHKVWGTLTMRRYATYDDLIKANKHFFNCVNRQIYGNDYNRKKLRLDNFSTIEKMANGNWHIHFSTTLADGYSIDNFIELLTRSWRNKVKGSGICDIEQIKNKQAVIGYQLKNFFKLGNDNLAI